MKEIIKVGGREYVLAAKVMERFDISYKAMYNWVDNGILPKPFRLGRRIFFDLKEVEPVYLPSSTNKSCN